MFDAAVVSHPVVMFYFLFFVDRQIVSNAPQGEFKRIMDPSLCDRLNKSAINIGQGIQHFFDMMKEGIYDNFDTWIRDKVGKPGNAHDQDFLFVHVVVFVWPFVCASSTANHLESEHGLHTFFKGSSAETFRDIVECLGFTEDTYPYYKTYEKEEDKNKVLRIWKAPKYEKV